MKHDKFQKVFLLLLVVAISLLFFKVVRPFVTTLFLAAIFSGLSAPLFGKILALFKGRRTAAAAATMVLVVLVVVLPFLGFLGILAAQAVSVTEAVAPWVTRMVDEHNTLDEILAALPFRERIEPYQAQILTKAGQLVSSLGGFLVGKLQAATTGTVAFLFQFFLLLYMMFFFLKDGRKLLERVFYYIPLPHEDEVLLAGKFLSVSKATLKGTLIIGAIQGVLGGLGFWVAGIGQAVFWGTLIAVLSAIPGVGPGFVGFPAVVFLAVTGRGLAAALLGVYFVVVVGLADNFLRPILVGRDTQMHDVLILLSTLGGILYFGIVGFIVGPIVAALFVAVWEMYGTAFKEHLPAVGSPGRKG